MADVEIRGVDKVKRALAALPPKVGSSLIRKGMVVGARIVKSEAMARVHVKTGQTRDAIKARKPSGTKRGEIRREVAATTQGGYFLEKGRKHQEATPFLAPALEAKRGEVFDAIADSVRTGIKD